MKTVSPSLNRADPLYDQVYEVLWARILSGEIRPGTRVSDLEWSEKLQVSRTPVREAMRKLQQDGVVMPQPRGGYELRRLECRDLQSLYRCRAALEALAVREAVEQLSKRQLDRLDVLIDRTQAALDVNAFERAFELNTQFHELLTSFSANPFLDNLLKGLRRMILFARASLMAAAHEPQISASYAEHLVHIQSDHRDIVALLRAGDGEAAAARMQQHLFATAEQMSRMASRLAVQNE